MAYSSSDRFRIINSIPYKLMGLRYETGDVYTYEQLKSKFGMLGDIDTFITKGIEGHHNGETLIKYLDKI